jgi:hypothetical protein
MAFQLITNVFCAGVLLHLAWSTFTAPGSAGDGLEQYFLIVICSGMLYLAARIFRRRRQLRQLRRRPE